MRFSRFAFSSVALLALSSIGYNGFVHADDAVTETATENPLDIDAVSASGETIEFQAEVSRVLDIVVNSLYQNKDVFLRELISNASDALDKARFLGITKPEIMAEKEELEIRLSMDVDEQTLTITDSGIGMTKNELVTNLGTVAWSGTSKFMDALEENAGVDQIGMFGVGFYSSFLVADKVVVASKSPSEDKQYVWISGNGDSNFSVAEDPRGNTLGRGTEITLHLKQGLPQYSTFDGIAKLVHHYSEFVTHPIYVRKTEAQDVVDEEAMEEAAAAKSEETSTDEAKDDELDVSEEEDSDSGEADADAEVIYKRVLTHTWEKCNSDQAIWNRPKDSITDDEYQDFFKMVTKNEYNASQWSHFDAEGNINFKSLVYMPHRVPENLKSGDLSAAKSSMKLYVRKVLISDDFELLPRYLSFVTGVVDSDDLPLNVNRETLQESKIIAVIRKKVTRKVIDMIKKYADSEMPEEEEEAEELDENGEVIPKPGKAKDPDDGLHPYIKWYKKFHPSIKMGIMEDQANKQRIAKLLRFVTSQSDGEYVSLTEYVERMKPWQKEIFFTAGTDIKELEKSPFMEKFNEKDIEVIYFTDAADEYMVQHMPEFDGKKFTTISKENIDIESDEEKDEALRRHKVYLEKFKPLTKFLNKFYGTKVMSVSVSKRLGTVPVIMSSSAYGKSANMERLMRAQAFAHNQGELLMEGMRTLEINPRHPFIHKLNEELGFDEDSDEQPELDITMKDALWNLLDTALLNGGYPVSEGKGFTNRMMRTIKAQLGVESVALLPEIEVPVEDDVPPEDDEEEETNLQEIVDHLDALGPDTDEL